MIKNTGLLFLLMLLCAHSIIKETKRNSFAPELAVAFDPYYLQVQKPDENGSELYQKYCLSCHQTDGTGVPGMYPSLKVSDWVNGDKSKTIKALLLGLNGEIYVNGKKFNQTMPPFNYLTDSQIASILTYIGSNFGNDASPVLLNDVRKLRNNK